MKFNAVCMAIVFVMVAGIALLPKAVLRRPLGQPRPCLPPPPDLFEIERKALRDAVERIAAAEGTPQYAVALLEAKADRLAARIAAGETCRGNAIHRLTAQARKHARPNRAVQEFIARIQTPTNAD